MKIQDNHNPLQAFGKDLTLELRNEKLRKEAIILLIDANNNIKKGKFMKMLEKNKIQEIILDKHRHNGPETYIDNTKQIPIDRIFASHLITFNKSGYFDYDSNFGTDHRVLWGSLQEERLLGTIVGNINKWKKKKTNH